MSAQPQPQPPPRTAHAASAAPWPAAPPRFDKSAWKQHAARLGKLDGMRPTTIHVLDVILRWLNASGYCWLGREWLADELGLKGEHRLSTISRAYSELAVAGLIKRKRTRYRPNQIRIVADLEGGSFQLPDVPPPADADGAETLFAADPADAPRAGDGPPDATDSDADPSPVAGPEAGDNSAQVRTVDGEQQCAGAHGTVRRCARNSAQVRTQRDRRDKRDGPPTTARPDFESDDPGGVDQPAGAGVTDDMIGGAFAARPMGDWVAVVHAAQRWKGAQLTVSEEAALLQYAAVLAEGPQLTIDGAAIDPLELLRRAFVNAVESCAEYQTIRRSLAYVKQICERCLRDQCWPGDFNNERAHRRGAGVSRPAAQTSRGQRGAADPNAASRRAGRY